MEAYDLSRDPDNPDVKLLREIGTECQLLKTERDAYKDALRELHDTVLIERRAETKYFDAKIAEDEAAKEEAFIERGKAILQVHCALAAAKEILKEEDDGTNG